MTPCLPALAGGALLGVSAVLLLLVNGRIAGISGIFGRLLGGRQIVPNVAFLAGLLAGPIVFSAFRAGPPAVTVTTPLPLLIVAGLLVGIGTRMGSGCTSGHGILGLARLSKRSAVATAVFLAAGIAAATGMGVLK